MGGRDLCLGEWGTRPISGPTTPFLLRPQLSILTRGRPTYKVALMLLLALHPGLLLIDHGHFQFTGVPCLQGGILYC